MSFKQNNDKEVPMITKQHKCEWYSSRWLNQLISFTSLTCMNPNNEITAEEESLYIVENVIICRVCNVFENNTTNIFIFFFGK